MPTTAELFGQQDTKAISTQELFGNQDKKTISTKDLLGSQEEEIKDVPLKASGKVDIDFLNQHPLYEQSGKFDPVKLPNFESPESAAAFYGLSVDKIRPITPYDLTSPTDAQQIDFSKKFIPNLELDPKYVRDGSIDPTDDYKSDWTFTSKAMDMIWEGELGLDEATVPQSIPGRDIIMGASDIIDSGVRALMSIPYGIAGVASDTITNITGDKQKGREAMDSLITLFEGTLPQQMSMTRPTITSLGNTKAQVKAFNKESKKLIDDYVETTFKDSPNKNKIKTELNKKFDEGNLKTTGILDRMETKIVNELKDPRLKFKNYDNTETISRFDKKDTPVENLWQFKNSDDILKYIDKGLSFFRTRGMKTPQMQRNYERMQSFVRDYNYRAQTLSRKIEKGIDTLINKLPKETRKANKQKLLDDVNEAIVGNKSLDDLPFAIINEARQSRKLVDDLTNHLLKSQSLNPKLKETLKNNLGTYLKRSYKAYEQNNYKPKTEVLNRAIDYLIKEDPKLTRSNAEGLLMEILGKSEDVSASGLSGVLPKLDKTIFKQRKDLPQPIRDFLGEVKDPRYNLQNTVNRMSKWLASDEYFNSILKEGANKYLFRKPNAKFFTKVTADKYNPLNGWYTTPKFKAVINNLDDFSYGTGFAGKVGSTFWGLKALSQKSKTVWNHISQIRNIWGMGQMVAFNGFNPFSKTGYRAFVDISKQILGKSDDAFNLKYQEYLNLGIVRTSVRLNEIKSLLKDAQGFSTLDEWLSKLSETKLGKLVQTIDDVYMGVDDIGKIIVYEKELETLRNAFPRRSLDDLKKEAAEVTTNTMPTYDKVPPSIKLLRKMPLSNFVSFQSEILRNSYHSIMRAAYELKTPGLQTRGAQRLAGNIAMGYLGANVVEFGFNFFNEITEGKFDAIKRFLPFWSKSNKQAVFNLEDNGIFTSMDLGQLDAYRINKLLLDTVIKSVAAGLDPEEELSKVAKDEIWNNIKEFYSPFLDEAILTKKAGEVYSNKKEGGGRIWNPQDPTITQWIKGFEHFAGAFSLGSINALEKVRKAALGEKGTSGREYDLETEVIANILGLRFNKIDPREALPFMAGDKRQAISDSEYIFRQTANNQSPQTIQDYTNSYLNAEKARYKNFSEMYLDVEAALELGVSRTDIQNTLKDSGFSNTDIASLLNNKYIPYYPSNESLLRIRESGNPNPDSQIRMVYNKLKGVPLNDYTAFNNNLKGEQ